MTLAKGVPRSQHTDLKSFSKLNHNTKSTIYRGTLFEYQTQSILRKCLGIYTHRSAGNDDRGVDLRGTWFLPTSASPKPGDLVRHLKVIVQCKSMSVKVGPKYVRELQGSLSYETQPTMAVLAINSDFTKMALLPYVRSLWPMALVVIDAKNHQCSKLIWNNAAEKVMQGIHIGTGWTYGDDGIKSRPALCFDGKVINRIPGPYLRKDEADTSGEKKAHLDPSWCINAEPEFHYVDPDTAGFWGGIEGEESEEVDMGFAHFHSAYEMKEFLHGERAP
ncbi:hypothetical protein BGX27_001746 [Mortierella sp. AM989]|nr:hypothetical protein BGX27_001746 [Mortierella sp. AM989]